MELVLCFRRRRFGDREWRRDALRQPEIRGRQSGNAQGRHFISVEPARLHLSLILIEPKSDIQGN